MSFLEFAATYFSATQVLAVLVLIYSTIMGLFLVFRANVERPRLRSNILLGIFALASSSWIFVGSSLVFCRAFESLYYSHEDMAVAMVLGTSLLATLVICLPVSAIMAKKLPALVLRRTEKGLLDPGERSSELMNAITRGLGMGSVALYVSPKPVPFAYSLGGGGGLVVISRGLEENLDKDEMETVLTHETAHLRNRDTQLNTLITVYRRVLFFDPLIRVLEGVIHREREFACDEVSARTTRKPMALASALIKIHSIAGTSKPPGAFLAGNIALRGDRTLRERLDRLLRISREMEKKDASSLQSLAD